MVNKDLHVCDFSKVDMSDADLSGSDFSFAKLDGAKLDRAELGQARWRWSDRKTKLPAQLVGVSLSQCDLTECLFRSDPDFREATLLETNLRNLHFVYVNFEKANMRSANLEGTGIYTCNLEGADLSDAIFDGFWCGRVSIDERTILEGSKWRGAHPAYESALYQFILNTEFAKRESEIVPDDHASLLALLDEMSHRQRELSLMNHRSPPERILYNIFYAKRMSKSLKTDLSFVDIFHTDEGQKYLHNYLEILLLEETRLLGKVRSMQHPQSKRICPTSDSTTVTGSS